MRHFSTTPLCRALTLAMLPGPIVPAFAQEPSAVAVDNLPGAEQIAADATCYLYRMGWDDLKPRLAGTPALAVIEDPQVQAFFAEVRRLGERHEAMADIYGFLLSALHQNVIIAGRSPGLEHDGSEKKPDAADQAENEEEEEANEQAEESGEAPPSQQVALVRASAAGQAAFRGLYDKMMSTVEEWAGKPEPTEVDGMEFDLLGDEEAGVYTGWKDDRFVWAVGPESAEWVASFGKGGDGSLAKTELFRATMSPMLDGMKSGPIAAYWYDLRPGWQRLAGMPGWDNLSWRSLDAVAGAAFVEDGAYRIRHYWKVGDEDQRVGLFRHSRESRIDPEWLKRVPPDATGFTTGVWDANSFMLSIIGLFAKVSGGDFMLEGAPQVGMMLKPLTDQMGPRYLVYRVPARYGVFPLANAIPLSNMVVVAGLKDAQAFATTLQQMAAMVPTGGDKVAIDGHEVTAINVMYFTLYLAVVEKELILTIHPQLIKDAVQGWKRPGDSLVDTPAYQAAAKHILPDACFEMYIAPGGFSRGIYDQYIPMLQQLAALAQGFSGMMGSGPKAIDPAARGFSPLAFPRGSDLARHAPSATILTARDDGTGVLFDGRSDVLCTPYYWTYLHALVRLNPDRDQGIWPLLQFLVMPLEPEDEEQPEAKSEQTIRESEPQQATPGEQVVE